jgi:hypothetical protein
MNVLDSFACLLSILLSAFCTAFEIDLIAFKLCIVSIVSHVLIYNLNRTACPSFGFPDCHDEQYYLGSPPYGLLVEWSDEDTNGPKISHW